MKIYVCDCCGRQIKNPYKVRMREFYQGIEILDMGMEIPADGLIKKRIDLCDDCYKSIAKLSQAKEQNNG